MVSSFIPSSPPAAVYSRDRFAIADFAEIAAAAADIFGLGRQSGSIAAVAICRS
jgi:hypothetical protein